jgi:general secretion pathway protein D
VRITSVWRAAFVLACSAVAGCTQPWQQLTLPGPIPPEAGPAEIAKANGSTGTPLSTPGREVTGIRTDPGNGQLIGKTEPRPLPAGGKDGVVINLSGASIAEAARLVLGDTLGVNFVVSEKLKGSITLQTATPIPREALLEVFEMMLAGEGAAIVVDKGIYRVLPTAEAGAGAPLQVGGGRTRRLPGVGTHVIPLRYVAAAEMERIVKSIAPQSTIVRVDTTRNLIVVAGTGGDVDAVMDAVAVFDVDWMKGMSFGLFPIETGDPEAIAQELDTVFANDQDGPGKGMVRFIPNRRLKAVLVITSRVAYLKKAETWMRRLDMVGKATEKQVHVYHIQHRPAAELAQLLQKVYGQQEPTRGSNVRSTGVTIINSPETAPRPTTFQVVPGVPAGTTGSPLPTAEVALPIGTDPALTPRPGAAAGTAADDRFTGIAIVPDETNNALVITATLQEYRRVRQILERIDVMPNQVLLEATIAEVRLTDELSMGLRWFFQMGNHQLKLTDSSVGAVLPVAPGFSSFFSTPNVQVVLNALSTITDVNIVSSPSIMVLDNKRATLQVGDEVPISTQSAVSVLTPGAPIVNSVSFRNTGIILNITPRINDSGRVLLDIEQEVSDVVATTTSKIDSPTIQQRRIKTTVSVNDGEGIVLGGLIQDKATNTRGQVPLAGDIPIFGNLFKKKDDTINRTELVVAITPRVVKDSRHIRAITEEFRDKINFTTRPQRAAPPDRREQVDRVLR